MEHTTASDFVGIVSANNIPDKMEKAGFTTVKSQYVNAPIINELPLTLECVLKQELDGGNHRSPTTRSTMAIIDLVNMWEMLLRMERS